MGAVFRRKVKAGSLQIIVDGYNCTESSHLYGDCICWSPSSDLRPGLHQVTVLAVDNDGTPIEGEWSFLVADENVRHTDSENQRHSLTVWNGKDLRHQENPNSNFFFER